MKLQNNTTLILHTECLLEVEIIQITLSNVNQNLCQSIATWPTGHLIVCLS